MNRYRFIIGTPTAVVLYSESDHPNENPVEVFWKAVETFKAMQKTATQPNGPLHSTPTSLTRFLLKERYRKDGGYHRAGDRMFIIDTERRSVDGTISVATSRNDLGMISTQTTSHQ